MNKKALDTIPSQHDGAEVNVEEMVELATEAEARSFFQTVKQRLLNVNGWHGLAGALSASFSLTDASGNEVTRQPQEGDFFRINIPAPGIEAGDGMDWVQIEQIMIGDGTNEDCVSVRVRPASSPLNSRDDVAHFYTDEATSNFIARRQGNKVIAGVYGRNEKPNVKEADSLLDKVRNAIVGAGGVSGLSKLQWKALVSGWMNPPQA